MPNPLEAANSELQALITQKMIIDSKIRAIQETIKILAPLYGESQPDHFLSILASFSDIGLTASVRKVLESHPNEELAPISIRDHVALGGFKFEGRSNPMAEVHQILKRLTESTPQIIAVLKSDGTYYKFDPSVPPKTVLYRRRRSSPPKPIEPLKT